LQVQAQATEAERLSHRQERLRATGNTPTPRPVAADWHEKPDPRQRFGETLRIVGHRFVCARCDQVVAKRGENPKDHLPKIHRELGELSPWIARRWHGVSPDFQLIEYVCPGCGYLIDTTQRRKNEPDSWNDYQVADSER
jgi:hypothetical protein